MTREKLVELKELAVTAIMFSLHSPDANAFNGFMGKESAWETMETGVKMCHDADLAVAFNTCLMRDDFYNGTFEQIDDRNKQTDRTKDNGRNGGDNNRQDDR
ncbi:hypothetical protein JCM17380_30100 [Desulfosporosinus burensis]